MMSDNSSAMPGIFYVCVHDSSLSPVLNLGRVAVCDSRRAMAEGDIVAVRTPRTTILRRYMPKDGYAELWTNAGLDFIVNKDPNDPCEIIGVCFDEIDLADPGEPNQ